MAETEANIELFKKMGIKVIAASSDDEAGSRKMASDQKLSFPVAYGVQSDDINKLGAFEGTRQEKLYIQPTEFIVNPAGEVVASMYSATQLGRMNPREILHFLKSRI